MGESYLQFVKRNPAQPSENILLNTYLTSEYMPDHKEHIFLVYKEVSYLKPFYQWLETLDMFISKYEIEEEEEVYTYCFKIDNSNLKSYMMFKNSKYSRIEDSYKRHILKFHNLSLDSRTSKILYKDESLYMEREEELLLDITIDRDQEIGTLIDLNVETHKKKVELKPNNKQTVKFD